MNRACGNAGSGKHQIRDEADFAQHVDYIHWNPVKHGLTACAIDWPYSTFHRFVSDGVVAPHWGLAEPVVMNAGEQE
jgi:putative transposase